MNTDPGYGKRSFLTPTCYREELYHFLFLFLLPLFFPGCGEPPGYLSLRFASLPPYTKEEGSLQALASATNTTVYLRWEGPSRGELAVPFSARRAEIQGIPPGTYTLAVSAAEQQRTFFATTITASVEAGKTTTITLPLGGFP